jgi:SAM-dependent methyltransferase
MAEAQNQTVPFEEAVRRILSVPWPPQRERSGLKTRRPFGGRIQDETALAAFAFALGAETVGALSAAEQALMRPITTDPDVLSALREEIQSGQDPLGEAFSAIRSAEARRQVGAIYTPLPIVNAMISWAETIGEPDRVIDPGSGSGRFLLEAGRRFPKAKLVAVEVDPLAALMARANLAAAGFANRADVRVEDFRNSPLNGFNGRTLYVGNPPYVRHHLIEPEWKAWLKREADAMKLPASALAGLHVYFFLAVARHARAGDYGALITAAEWLDVNYGQLVRDLFLDRLGGQAVYVIEPKAEPFPGTATTGAITIFKVNGKPTSARFARVDRLDTLDSLASGHAVRRERLAAESRWSHFTRPRKAIPEGYTDLGELCRVHRGQVTGANRIWIAGPHSAGLPDTVLFPSITKALELFRAGVVLADDRNLKRVIDLPADLALLQDEQRAVVERFLKYAEQMGGKRGYTATHRKAWWSVGLREPAAILATYMARRPPAFVLNQVEARHLNIAHGLYPRESMDAAMLNKLVRFLRQSATTRGGREYAGGLTKFEPREMERIPVPEPALLMEMSL